MNIFSAYVVPLLKDINYTELLQEWKINLGAAVSEINIDVNMSKPSDKKETDCHYSDLYWPTTIKDTIVVSFSHHYGTYCKYSRDK